MPQLDYLDGHRLQAARHLQAAGVERLEAADAPGAFTFAGWREPNLISCLPLRNAFASDWPTLPVPMMAILITAHRLLYSRNDIITNSKIRHKSESYFQ